jgi:hypothetical protein
MVRIAEREPESNREAIVAVESDQVCDLLNLARQQHIAQEEVKAAHFLDILAYGRRQ